MENPTVETSLYRQIAKDFTPKKAEMRICEHIEAIEAAYALKMQDAAERLEALEKEYGKTSDLSKRLKKLEDAARNKGEL